MNDTTIATAGFFVALEWDGRETEIVVSAETEAQAREMIADSFPDDTVIVFMAPMAAGVSIA